MQTTMQSIRPAMAKCKLHIHPVALVLIIFGVLAWVVALGGLAASTYYCYQNDSDSQLVIENGEAHNATMVPTPGGCVNAFSLPWWSIWFELFILVVMFGTCFVDAFDKARYIYLSYLSMATFFLTISARDFITQSLIGGGVNPNDYNLDAYNASAAGCIMLAVTNYGLIIFIGLGATTDIPDMVLPGRFGAAMSQFTTTRQEQKYQPSTTEGF